MTKFVPSGYLSIRDALDRLGRELFPSAWTGEEQKARRGLISEEEWLKNKDLPPARGAGACGSGEKQEGAGSEGHAGFERRSFQPYVPGGVQGGEAADGSTSSAARTTRGRSARGGHIGSLERETAPSLGFIVASVRCRSDDRKGEAPIPGRRNTGSLLVRRFAEANAQRKPMSPARIREAIAALKEKIATESLTRPQQADFLRKTFASYHVTERQLAEIYQAVPVPTGRPRKPDK